MFYKAVYSVIDPPKFLHRSITDSPYTLEYYPGEWIHPTLSYSKLFVYNSLFSAIQVHGKPTITRLPYAGITLWSCYVLDAVKIDPLKGPPGWIMERFWKLRAQGLTPYRGEGYDMFPWIYRFKEIPNGVYAAKAVELLHIMGPDDWEGIRTPVIYYY
jgi:hypothetical protein